MPSFFLLLLMSLTVASNEAKDKTRLPSKAASKASATQARAAAVKDEKDETKEPSVEAAIRSVSLPIEGAKLPPALAQIEAEAKGLLVQSEIDAPFIVKFFRSDKLVLTTEEIVALALQKAGAPVEIQTVERFLENSTLVENWMSDDEKAMARRFQLFIVTLKAKLQNPQVYLIGEREKTVVIIGNVEGGFGAVMTLVVET